MSEFESDNEPSLKSLRELGEDRPLPVSPEDRVQTYAAAKRRRRTAQIGVGGVAAALALAVPLVLVGPFGTDRGIEGTSIAQPASPNATTDGRSGEVPQAGIPDCVQIYTFETLRTAEFAFDGTITSIKIVQQALRGRPPTPMDDAALVTFRVNEWFRGGNAPEVTLRMIPPTVMTAEDNKSYDVGTRMLLPGAIGRGGEGADGYIAWEMCGFAHYYTERTASNWRKALR